MVASTRRQLAIATALLSASVAWAGGALADEERGGSVDIPTGDATVVEELVDTLCQSGELPPARCAALRAKLDVAAPAAPPVSEEGPTWDFLWNNGFRLERSDGMYKLKFGGRIMVDFAGIDLSPGAQQIADAIDAPVEDGFGVEFRRARIYFSGELYKRILFKAQYDFAGGDVDFKDVYVGMKQLSSSPGQSPTPGPLQVGSRAGAVAREVVALSVSRVSPFVPV